MGLSELIRKYSTSGPRYTSYPTAPQWKEEAGEATYRGILSKLGAGETGPLALYVHLPFCEQLCYYCGCNIQITKDHGRSRPYVERVIEEIREVSKLLGKRRSLCQISWGGGTPTFSTVDEIKALHKATLESFDLAPEAEVSIEIDPRVTSDEQLEVLRALGFNRASLGVQDFHPEVQKAVNRIQSAEMTERMLKKCHSLGFKGVNFDLMYGLPFQTVKTFQDTISQIIRIRPERIALYNYAHLPALLHHQKILEKSPMPSAKERVEIFGLAYEALTKAGYRSIGMDHFAVESDELYLALTQGYLYRNFMGYTVKKGSGMLGVGASAIGDVGNSYFQNTRQAKVYEKRVQATGLATMRGCVLSDDDRQRKWVIQSIMCQFRLETEEFEKEFGISLEAKFQKELSELDAFFQDGILKGTMTSFQVTDLGRVFIRNVAMLFDAYLAVPSKATYSKTV